jgi:predicted metallo-beta-lactamase superfamily hydrolase
MSEKKIAIVGSGSIGTKSIVNKALQNEIDVIVVDEENTNDESFFVNGVKYVPIQKEVKKHSQSSSRIRTIMDIATMIYAPYMDDLYGGVYDGVYVRSLPKGTDIIKEYGLIQKKQSTLSKWERDAVVNIFERNFIKAESKTETSNR